MTVTKFRVRGLHDQDISALEGLKRSVRQVEIEGCYSFVLVTLAEGKVDGVDFFGPSMIAWDADTQNECYALLGLLSRVQTELTLKILGEDLDDEG